MILMIEDIARQAGECILKYYNNKSISIEKKADGSPVTTADLEANDIITKGLKKNFPYPILSEEDVPSYEERQHWETYWLVDPLDGTKGFINRSGDFTVNIALVKNGTPLLGVIYAPKTNEMFSAEHDQGAKKDGRPIKNSRQGDLEIGVASKLHQGGEKQLLEQIGITQTIYVNSSLKMCWLAEGKADVYPRMRPTMEWDTGAGEILLKEAGCEIMTQESLEPLPHNKENLENPPFIAYRKTDNLQILGI